MQPNITVTELLQKLKKEKPNDYDNLDESELLIEDTHTDIQQTEQDDLEPLYQEIDDLKEQIDKLIKRIEKIEKQNKTRVYKEEVKFQEINPLYNNLFNIPENERTYKPVIVKEEVKESDSKNKTNTKTNIFRNQSKNRKRSQSKHRKYK